MCVARPPQRLFVLVHPYASHLRLETRQSEVWLLPKSCEILALIVVHSFDFRPLLYLLGVLVTTEVS